MASGADTEAASSAREDSISTEKTTLRMPPPADTGLYPRQNIAHGRDSPAHPDRRWHCLSHCRCIEPDAIRSQRAHVFPRGSIVVADFVNATGDPVFDDTLTQALTIELRQSPALEVLPDSTVRATLRMMGFLPISA